MFFSITLVQSCIVFVKVLLSINIQDTYLVCARYSPMMNYESISFLQGLFFELLFFLLLNIYCKWTWRKV